MYYSFIHTNLGHEYQSRQQYINQAGHIKNEYIDCKTCPQSLKIVFFIHRRLWYGCLMMPNVLWIFSKNILLISITILLYFIDTIFYVYTKLNFNGINTIGETRTQFWRVFYWPPYICDFVALFSLSAFISVT